MARKKPTPTRAPVTGARLWTLRIATALLAPLVVLALLEGGLRLGGYGYDPGFALEVPDRGTLGTNLRFGWRFFPRATARVPLLFEFAEEKPADTVRVFVLGASAAQGYPTGSFSFARILEVMLERAWPAADFEVINTSIAATNSHVVLPIAREVVEYDPDLLIVYLGNNEVIGPYGIGSGRSDGGGIDLIRTGIALREWRVGQAVDAIAGSPHAADGDAESWRGMEQYAQRHVPLGDERLARVYAGFERNLEDICAAAEAAGVPVLLSTLAVNDWDCAPFASARNDDLSAEDREAWDRAFRAGSRAQDHGDHGAAAGSFDEALALDDGHAELRYRLGRSLLAVGDTAAAAVEVRAARELDVLRFRADDGITAVTRSVAGRMENTDLVDVRSVFESLPPEFQLPRRDRLFYEHVHLTLAGNHRIAAELFGPVSAHLPERLKTGGTSVPAALDDCAADLVHTVWDEYRSIQTIGVLLGQAPFPGRYDHDELLRDWAAELDVIRADVTREALEGIIRAKAEAVEARPDDLLLRVDYIDLLKEIGRRDEARRHWAEIARRQPPPD